MERYILLFVMTHCLCFYDQFYVIIYIPNFCRLLFCSFLEFVAYQLYDKGFFYYLSSCLKSFELTLKRSKCNAWKCIIRIFSRFSAFPAVVICLIICFCYLQSRWDILKIHSRRMNLMRGIDLKKIAEKMNGASGAELKVTISFQIQFFLSVVLFCSLISILCFFNALFN